MGDAAAIINFYVREILLKIHKNYAVFFSDEKIVFRLKGFVMKEQKGMYILC